MIVDSAQQAQVDGLEITYVDPRTGNVCRKDVFCDPQQWEWRWQARFLISAELVNLLSEAYTSRQERFKQAHERLKACRLGYLVDLWRLRRGIEGVMAVLPPEDLGDAPDAGGEGKNGGVSLSSREVGPVHFFIPDHYMDAWTVEHLAMATEACREALREEIQDLTQRLNVIGAADWRQLLELILGRGVQPQAVAGLLMGSCQDADERRAVENFVTDGLADKLEALRPSVESFEADMEDCANRGLATEQKLRQRIQEIELLEQALERLRQREPSREAAKLDLSGIARGVQRDPVEEQKELDANLQRIREAWAQQLKLTSDEVERMRALAAEWRTNLAGCREEDLSDMEQRARGLRQRACRLQSEAQAATAKADGLRERVAKIEEQVAESDEGVSGLAHRLSSGPPADPRAFLFERLQRELKSLQREEAAIRKQMLAPHTRIRAIRHDLRQLYRKLGWEWDLSDSDDDDDYNDKPYWQRRKLATNGLAPFDERLFLYSEKSFQSRRLRRHEARERSHQEATVLQQIAAKRQVVGAGCTKEVVDGLGEVSDSVGPFKNHGGPIERDSVMTFQRATSSSATLRQERRQRDTAELGQQRSQTVQLRELRASFEGRLRQCISCFVDLLPPEGVLGEQRNVLCNLLEHLGALPEDASTWTDDSVGRQLDFISTSLHTCINEVASLGDDVHPVCGALQNSVEFGGLRQRLGDLRRDQKQMQLLLEIMPGSSGLQCAAPAAPKRVLVPEPTQDSVEPSSSSKSVAVLLGGSRSTAALPQLADPLQAPGKANKRRDLAKPEVVNFGFRPDGAGEDSLENWSLFKVSKGSIGLSGTTADVTSTTGSFRATRSLSLLRDSTISSRFQKLAPDCDFKEYMHQAQQGNQDMWRTASSPELSLVKKRGPSLPQLVSNAQKAQNAVVELHEGDAQARRSGQQSLRPRAGRSSFRQAVGGIGATKR